MRLEYLPLFRFVVTIPGGGDREEAEGPGRPAPHGAGILGKNYTRGGALRQLAWQGCGLPKAGKSRKHARLMTLNDYLPPGCCSPNLDLKSS